MKALLCCWLVCLPLKNLHITSPFGYRIHPLTGKYAFHRGVDLRADRDTVYAVTGGFVKGVGFDDHLGIFIRVSQDSLQSVYGHLSRVFVGEGEEVAAGDPIAITGATGRVTGEHLHLSMLYNNRPIDPVKFLYKLIIKKDHE